MEITCINTRLLTRNPLKARTIKVDSFTKFWVQLHNSHEDFKELIDELTRRMMRRADPCPYYPITLNWTRRLRSKKNESGNRMSSPKLEGMEQ